MLETADALLTKSPLSLSSLTMNLVIGVFLSLILSMHYRRIGSTLSNRSELATIFPFITLTTILIISVVKSSLALSLGLVGALSIVRFRTPIKEPEELAYLFMTIAIGLGLGADQTFATIVATAIITISVALVKKVIFKQQKGSAKNRRLFMSIELQLSKAAKETIDGINKVISDFSIEGDMRKLDIRNNSLEMIHFFDVKNSDMLTSLIESLQDSFPEIKVTVLDQSQMPSV